MEDIRGLAKPASLGTILIKTNSIIPAQMQVRETFGQFLPLPVMFSPLAGHTVKYKGCLPVISDQPLDCLMNYKADRLLELFSQPKSSQPRFPQNIGWAGHGTNCALLAASRV